MWELCGAALIPQEAGSTNGGLGYQIPVRKSEKDLILPKAGAMMCCPCWVSRAPSSCCRWGFVTDKSPDEISHCFAEMLSLPTAEICFSWGPAPQSLQWKWRSPRNMRTVLTFPKQGVNNEPEAGARRGLEASVPVRL